MKLSEEEAEEVIKVTHHFTYPGVVSAEGSYETRPLNDSKTNIPNSCSTYSLMNPCPNNPIGHSLNVQNQFRLHKHAYTSDVSKAYLRILVDDDTAKLRSKKDHRSYV